ncbi:hypothetical protein COCON_G00185950 [Conger conger]|uniref:Anaphylatoxin-like domain-containing protein n=1 Tax=Conger conger TaxID=82655 RepID=A0A9Q1HR13_CONCO|nr:hypothetical protein COCON_G00185950 [Conger conger]
MDLALLLVICAFSAVSAQTPQYLITAPSLVHVGVEESVTVQLHQATRPVTITLYFRHQSKDLSHRQTVTLNAGNSYQAVVKLKVEPDLYKDTKFGRVPYVNLVAEGGVKNSASCLLSTRKGYIFIQTDKPIYNPGEAAKYRIFTLDNYMRPTDESITIHIFNSKGLMVYKGNVLSKQIFQRHIDIPGVEQAGHWRIVASFTDLPMSNSSVEFEVREYVLPSFEVKIESAKKYHLLKAESFQFSVSARYTYGKGVNGIAYARFGIIDEQGNKTFLPGLEKQTAILDGNAEITLLTKDLRGKAESLDTNIEGQRIYIAVTALETASGELEEAESSSVKIVNSPYTIDLSKTKQYFTPEGLFSILATTTYPDGTPAPGLLMKASVEVRGQEPETIEVQARSKNNGEEVALTFKVPRLAESLDIKVFAEGEDKDVVLSDAHMTASATVSKSKSYLSVEVPHLILEKGQELTVTFRDITPPGRQRPTHIYYMIFSKGRVVRMNKVQRSEVTSVSLPFSHDLVPAFRVVAYYFASPTEFVADSVWVDVQDVCEGQVRIQPFEEEYKPGGSVDVMIHTEGAEKVALAAIDTAVYILNKRNKLTAQKMFDYMNSYDLACTNGGGKDHISVFTDAGLTFISSSSKAPLPHESSCHSVRRKRSTKKYSQEFAAIVNQYNQPNRKCCNDGAKLNTRASCQQRHAKTRHRSSSCQAAFLKCCQDATALRERMKRDQKKHSIARTASVDDLDALDQASIHLRSYFPQSWMWQIQSVDASGIVSHHANLPDSITTWEIQTIGISQRNGFCIAEPQQLKVFQDFFVSVKLPYSVKKNEQLEVKAVVYNYKTELLQVIVKMAPAEGLCSAGDEKDTQSVSVPGNSAVPVYFTVVPMKVGKIPIQVTAFANADTADKIKKILTVEDEGELVFIHKDIRFEARVSLLAPVQVIVKMAPAEGLCSAGDEKDTQSVSVPGNSAVPVYFTVVPMKVGKIPIQVTAFANADTADKIKKILTVEDEGELVFIHKDIRFEARGANELEIDIQEPTDAVPGSKSSALISVRGGVMGESAENCLNLEGVDRLIQLPTGCAEQTMVIMSPAIHAMKYLDATDQWLYLSSQRRDEAKAMIEKGYTTVLAFMKPDGSYGAFLKRPSSVWLTAFIAKELSRARTIIAVDDSYILRSISYLMSKQLADGGFTDPNPLYDRTMQGGVGGVEGDVSLTAFVLVAMHHSLPAYPIAEDTKTRVAIMNAETYLEGKLESLQRPFAIAITAYALSLAFPGSAVSIRAKSKLKDIAKCDDAKGTCHWEAAEGLRLVGEARHGSVPLADSLSIEMTAYALLAALTTEGQDLQQARKIAKWLTEQRQYGGGFRSTQDTVVALEALADFSSKVNDVQDLDLNMELCLSKTKREWVHLTKRNAMTQPAFQVTPGNKVTAAFRGTGDGTFSLLHTYRSMKKTDLYCDYYHLKITLEGEVTYKQRTDDEPDLDDYYNYEQGPAADEPMGRVEWFDLRTRRKRHAPEEPEKEASLVYTACVSMTGGNSTGMAIVDISLLSGLEPNIQDLENQAKGTERYIDHYDLGKNKVYLYFNQVTESTDCVTFRAKQITPVGLVQPASAVIYDYYNPERRCSVFYSAPQKSTMLSKLCSGDVCACAEGYCPKKKSHI